MTTPPKIEQAAVDQAVKSIIARHVERGDQLIDEIGDSASDVLFYLQKYVGRFSRGLRADDMADVKCLLLADWWEHRRRQRFWLHQLEPNGMTKKEMGEAFGMRSPTQAVTDWTDRLDVLLDETGTGRPDEQVARDDRRSLAEEANRPATEEQRWLEAHLGDYEQLARDLVGLYMVVDERAAEQIIEVRSDLRHGSYEADHLVVLGMAMEALEVAGVDVHRPHLDEGEQYSAQEDREYEQRVADAQRRIEQVLRRFADLQRRRRRAAGTVVG